MCNRSFQHNWTRLDSSSFSNALHSSRNEVFSKLILHCYAEASCPLFIAGIREQGLYRNCGVTSKVQKLMQLGLDKRKGNGDKLNFNDDEWEIKTISSAVKTFLRYIEFLGQILRIRFFTAFVSFEALVCSTCTCSRPGL